MPGKTVRPRQQHCARRIGSPAEPDTPSSRRGPVGTETQRLALNLECDSPPLGGRVGRALRDLGRRLALEGIDTTSETLSTSVSSGFGADPVQPGDALRRPRSRCRRGTAPIVLAHSESFVCRPHRWCVATARITTADRVVTARPGAPSKPAGPHGRYDRRAHHRWAASRASISRPLTSFAVSGVFDARMTSVEPFTNATRDCALDSNAASPAPAKACP
jgi:hypothetical protein